MPNTLPTGPSEEHAPGDAVGGTALELFGAAERSHFRRADSLGALHCRLAHRTRLIGRCRLPGPSTFKLQDDRPAQECPHQNQQSQRGYVLQGRAQRNRFDNVSGDEDLEPELRLRSRAASWFAFWAAKLSCPNQIASTFRSIR